MKHIPEHEMVIAFTRSSGPGGQNVNKTSTKAQLRWPLWLSPTFTEQEKAIIRRKLANRITSDDELLIENDETRSQSQNKENAIQRLRELVAHALVPEKPRIATKPTRAARRKRLDSKKISSKKKANRRVIVWNE